VLYADDDDVFGYSTHTEINSEVALHPSIFLGGIWPPPSLLQRWRWEVKC
jgi:hypothetical protein